MLITMITMVFPTKEYVQEISLSAKYHSNPNNFGQKTGFPQEIKV